MSIRAVLKVALDKAHADMEKASADLDKAETDLTKAQAAKDQARAAWIKADADINSAYDALKEIDQLEGKPIEYWLELSRAGKL